MTEPANDNPQKVIELGAHDNMTPEDVLKYMLRRNPEDVLMCGYIDGEFFSVSSHMTRERAVFLLEHAKMHALGFGDD